MRVLVVDPNRTERETTLRRVPAGIHDTKSALDAAEALRLLESEPFDVVLVESTMTEPTGNELVKRIRDRESSAQLYIIVTASRPVPGDLKTAFAVGADDFIRKPVNAEELLARIDGPNRVRRWAELLYKGGHADASELRPSIASLDAWSAMDSTICTELSDMLGFRLAPTPSNDTLDAATSTAMLPLSIVAEQAELRLGVGLDAASAAVLAEAMFGSPDVDAAGIDDMLKEIANVAGGAFKRLAAKEGRCFTTHLPVETDAVRFRHPNPNARRQWIATCEGAPITLRFEVELLTTEPKLVRVSSLLEGMVIAADVRNSRGALLVKCGTRVTESQLFSLASSIGPDMCVEVIEAA